MIPISIIEMQSILDSAGIEQSDSEIGIGRQLSCVEIPTRSVVIHFSENQELPYIATILRILLSIENEWILYPRYGDVNGLAPIVDGKNALSVLFGIHEKEQIISTLVELSDSVRIIEYDPYILTLNGHILATWDHHIFSDGFTVNFTNIEYSTKFISALNNFGAEFEVFYADA